MIDRIAEFIVKQTSKVLHLPYATIHYSLVQTIDGKVISDTGKRRAKSWNRNAYNMLLSQLSFTPYTGTYGAGKLSLKYTSGGTAASATSCWRTTANLFSGAAGISTTGTLIGTSNTAESFEDFKILTQIPEGMGTGQVNYGATFWSRAYVGTTLTIQSKRYFNNNSDGSIDIGEMTLQSGSYVICREAFSPKETFYDKAQLQAVFEISLLYPS